MGTMKSIAKNKHRQAGLASNAPGATANRAGGVSLNIDSPALKLITMTGGSFFAEPRYYNGDAIVAKRIAGGRFERLAERLMFVDEGLKNFASCAELDDVAREVISTAVAVANSDSPEDLLAIANWLRNEMNIRLTPQVLLVLASRIPATQPFVRKYAKAIVIRPDEVKTCLSMHRFFFGSKTVKNCLGQGLSDALAGFGERGLMKYDGSDFPKWKDVLCWLPRSKGRPLPAPVAKYFITGEVVDPAATPVIAARKALAQCSTFDDEAKELAKTSLVNWEVLLSQFGRDESTKKDVWKFLLDNRLVGYMACLAEGTPVWMGNGTTMPIEEVVAKKMGVLSYSQEWDARPVKYGPNQPKRSQEIGDLSEVRPTAWLDNGIQPVSSLVFQSGRVIEATQDHRWITRRRSGVQAWEWKTTDTLRIGDQVPMPLTAAFWGTVGTQDEGYFVGAMLGDGSMVSCTPDFSADDSSSGMVDVLRRFVEGKGCRLTIKCRRPHFTRYRFAGTEHKKNPIIDLLREYQVWGQKCDNKALPNLPFSRNFWTGCLAGLIDTDGCVRMRKNQKGYAHVSVEYASVSEILARQVSDAMLRLGIQNLVRFKDSKCPRHLPVWVVEVNAAQSVVALAKTIQLHVKKKASLLLEASQMLASVKGKKCGQSDKHAYSADVVMDRLKSIEPAGEKKVYCVTVPPSGLFIANGLVTGNCLRNLRNLMAVNLPKGVMLKVADRLANREQVLRSRQLPFRFLSAHSIVSGLSGDQAIQGKLLGAIEDASNISAENVPALPGVTAVFADNSGSMSAPVSGKSQVSCADAANVLCGIIAKRADLPYVCAFGTDVGPVTCTRNDTVMGIANKVRFADTKGMSTNGHRCIEWLMQNGIVPDRVVILSDMQCWNDCWGSENVADAWQKFKRQPGAKDTWIHCVHLNGYGDNPVKSGGDRVNLVSGFSEKVVTMLLQSEGAFAPKEVPTVDQVREVWTLKD